VSRDEILDLGSGGLARRLLAAATLKNEYFFFAGYTVLMFVVLATAWNILGGYAGYVNFRHLRHSSALAPTRRRCCSRRTPLPLALQIVAAAVMSGLLGLRPAC
jgi:branched-chain amino acid transport system permease protein